MNDDDAMHHVGQLLWDQVGAWLEEAPDNPLRPRKKFDFEVREMLLIAQKHICAICRTPLALLEAHVDHIVPRHAGGTDGLFNLQLVHAYCNLKKGGTQPSDAPMQPWA